MNHYHNSKQVLEIRLMLRVGLNIDMYQYKKNIIIILKPDLK
jgi:hypothetical protein